MSDLGIRLKTYRENSNYTLKERFKKDRNTPIH